MIIKNNFNMKDANPLEDYHGIGKGKNSLDNTFLNDENNLPIKNINNPITQDIKDDDNSAEDELETNEDKWSFFR